MSPEEWRELCKRQGSSVWSLIVQLLQFAAREDPEEFRRRRDGLAEVLFSPELSRRPKASLRSSVGPCDQISGDEVHLSSDWTPHAAASVVTECRKDSSQVTPPRTQLSQAGEGIDSRHGHTDCHKRDVRTDHQPRITSREVKPSSSASARVCAGQSAELPLPPALPKGDPVGRQGPSGNSLPSEAVRDNKLHHRNNIPLQIFSKEHIDRRHVEAKESKSRSQGKDTPGPLPRDVKDAPEASQEQQDEDGDKELCAVVEDAMDMLLSEDKVLQTVADIKAFLQPEQPPSEIISKLRELHALPVTVDILQTSQVAKAVKKVLKKNKNAEVQSFGSSLIRDWKELVSKSCSEIEVAAEDSHTASEEAAVAAQRLNHDADVNVVEEQPHSWLAAPPLEDDVFAMDVSADMGFQNCLTDFDSLGSELSGTVASAGGHSLTNKTPESHRLLGSSESSPCETNRPLLSGATGSQPQSVLSESVRKAGWNDTGGSAALEKQENMKHHHCDSQAPATASHGRSTEGVHKARLTSTTLKHALPGPLRIEGKASVPRPVPLKSAGQSEQPRLELAKRKLHERSQDMGEAKKFKTIQVVDNIAEPKLKPKGKPPFKHGNGFKAGARLGQRL